MGDLRLTEDRYPCAMGILLFASDAAYSADAAAAALQLQRRHANSNAANHNWSSGCSSFQLTWQLMQRLPTYSAFQLMEQAPGRRVDAQTSLSPQLPNRVKRQVALQRLFRLEPSAQCSYGVLCAVCCVLCAVLCCAVSQLCCVCAYMRAVRRCGCTCAYRIVCVCAVLCAV